MKCSFEENLPHVLSTYLVVLYTRYQTLFLQHKTRRQYRVPIYTLLRAAKKSKVHVCVRIESPMQMSYSFISTNL